METPSIQLDELAADYLAHDLHKMQSDAAILEREIEHAEQEHQRAMQGLHAKLRAMRYAVATLSAELTGFQQPQLGLDMQEPKREKVTPPRDAENMGFRDLIRTVLREADRGLKPKEIAGLMLKRGLQYTGKVDLSTRVSNDLRRLKESKKVKRLSGRYYNNAEANNGAH